MDCDYCLDEKLVLSIQAEAHGFIEHRYCSIEMLVIQVAGYFLC